MKAVLCTRSGGPRDLELQDVPDPIAGPGQAVVAVSAVALNFFDLLIIAGKYQVKPPFPFSPASEFAGTVESIGSGVTGVHVGDAVIGHIRYGAAREKVAVPVERLTPMPPGLDATRAAGLSVTYGTSLHALKDRGRLKAGETLAVLGATGGVGLSAVEIGKAMEARVIACASSAEKLAFARTHGADETLNYASEDLKEGLRRLTGGAGADVIYDPVGGAYTEPALRAIAWGGRFLVVGFAAGDIPRPPLNLALLRSCDIQGVAWGAWTERDFSVHRANMRQVLDWCAAGRLSAHVHATYPLADIADALEMIADRKVMGKVVLTT